MVINIVVDAVKKNIENKRSKYSLFINTPYEMLKKIAKKGVNITAKGYTPLAYLISRIPAKTDIELKNGEVKNVQVIDAYPTKDIIDPAYIKYIELLLDCGANIDDIVKIYGFEMNVLQMAARLNIPLIFDTLLEYMKKNYSKERQEAIFNKPLIYDGEAKNAILNYNIRNNNIYIIKSLLESNIDVNKYYDTNSMLSPLSLSLFMMDSTKSIIFKSDEDRLKEDWNENIEKIYIHNIKKILEKTKNVNYDTSSFSKTITKGSALHFALKLDDDDILDMILDKIIEENNGISYNDIIYMVKFEYKDDLERIFKMSSFDLGEQLLNEAEHWVFHKDMNEWIISKFSRSPWKGWSRSFIEFLEFLDKSKADTNESYESVIRSTSACPVCLKYVVRQDGCNYMSHDCSKERGYYNIILYNRYKTSEGIISWCTICGRICKGHNHYILDKADKKHPKIFISGTKPNPFEKDCRMTSGGGGIPEKMARFTRLYQVATEIQDKIDKISKYEAYNTLIKAVWDAPLTHGNITNFNVEAWKAAIPKFLSNKNAKNAKNAKNEENDDNDKKRINPFNAMAGKPKIETFDSPTANAILGSESKYHIELQHKGFDHKNTRVTGESLIEYLKSANSTHGLGSFGYCYMQPSCKAILYPEEVEAALEQLPEEELKAIEDYRGVLEKYKKHFYEKFKTTTKGGGGGEESGPLTPLEHGVCVLPPRRPKNRINSAFRTKTRRKSKSKSNSSSKSRSKSSKTRKSN